MLRLDEIIAPVAEHADVGVCIRSLDRGDDLYARNADAAFVPASNQKLLVTAAALDTLGPGFTFTTRALTLGPRRAATLRGDLDLQGGGDPTLATAGLAALADRVVAAGIRHVAGHVRGDDSIFDRRRRGIDWAWDDEAYPYAAPISGLTLNRNTVGVEVRPGARAGLPPIVRLDPVGAPIALRIRALTVPGSTPAALHVDRTRARDEIVISGQLPCGSAPVLTRVTVEDPPLYAAAVFTALLRARGIRVDGAPVALGTPGSAVSLAEIRSAPLAAILREMNKQSENLVVEMLLKALGMRANSSTAGAGIGGAGEAVLRAFLARAGLHGPSLVLADGSGLSRENLISPRNLVLLLAAMDQHPCRDAFFASLPVAGVDGTLRRRMIGTTAAGAVRAKTGTLAHVTALSGLVTTRDGERLAFSILTNNYPGRLSEPGGPRAMEDAIAVALAGFRRSGVQIRSIGPIRLIRPIAGTPERPPSLELRPHDNLPVLPAAVDAARQGAGDLQPIATAAEFIDQGRLPRPPERALLAAVLKPERETALPAPDPQEARALAAVLHTVISQFPGGLHGRGRVMNSRHLGEIADPLTGDPHILEAGQLYGDHHHPSPAPHYWF